ncbi:thiamine phosphate synthase [Pseudodesulfovibrio piezophilus]|uniref:Thiamine-phosphate synthase n=1 Tax=Pseudodesulfovibrio piezophilus (strain DSM 21447 / JCM 15486 / C1TLV30) TaxID=1322246 RepID=M1WP57_PSEP2|nr:thiamine phosphate synthase [Pseudodesulfovibrio piezophilus]CCH48064.1 Thiamine-phosphate pyrophosphorylase [Pseudodesulfovibrio piezophilus C1TLV30]
MGREFSRHTILDTDLYCLTAEKFSLDRSNLDVVKAMLESGVSLIQYREKEKKSGEKYQECLAIRQMTRDAGAAFIVNDDIDLALMVEADGVHIGQEDFPVQAVRNIVGEKMAIGLSTHSPEEAREAVRCGADYIGVGPIFKTFTKDDVVDPVGFEYLEYVVGNVDIPFVAIGGIKEHNVAEVVRRGARCVAIVTEIVGSEDIGGTINALRQKMQHA